MSGGGLFAGALAFTAVKSCELDCGQTLPAVLWAQGKGTFCEFNFDI